MFVAFDEFHPLFTYKKQVRFPKSRRKRIRKKWAARDENYKTFSKLSNGRAMMARGMIYVSFETYYKLQADRERNKSPFSGAV